MPIEYVGEDGLPEPGLEPQPQFPPERPVRATPVVPERPKLDMEEFRRRFLARTPEEPSLAQTAERLEESTKRTRRHSLPASEQELARWAAAAEAEGVSLNEYLRLAADERAAVFAD